MVWIYFIWFLDCKRLDHPFSSTALAFIIIPCGKIGIHSLNNLKAMKFYCHDKSVAYFNIALREEQFQSTEWVMYILWAQQDVSGVWYYKGYPSPNVTLHHDIVMVYHVIIVKYYYEDISWFAMSSLSSIIMIYHGLPCHLNFILISLFDQY